MVASELTASAMALGATRTEDGNGNGNDNGNDNGVSQKLPALQNRASGSKSPYVKSQADSPVLWQLLDDEAVERARKENKLIFLHIGYKACHCKSAFST